MRIIRMMTGLLAVICMTGAGLLKAEDDLIKTTACPPCKKAPVLDGKLEDACWSKAAVIAPFLLPSGGSVVVQTTVRVCHDTDNLYIGFQCDEPFAARMKKAVKDRDGKVWEDDGVEVFLDLKHDHTSYYHLILTCANVQFDEINAGQGCDSKWNGKWASAVAEGPDFWSAEIRMPFKTLQASASEPGKTWGVNFNRTRYAGGGVDLSNWSPTHGSAHAPLLFGDMVFGSVVGKLESIAFENGRLKGSFPSSTPATLRVNFENDDKSIKKTLEGQLPAFDIALPQELQPMTTTATLEVVAKEGNHKMFNATYPLIQLAVAEYRAGRALGPIKIDGVLDEESWSKAKSTGLFYQFDGKTKTEFTTEAKLLWDDQRLYIAVTCKDPKIIATKTERDDSTWDEDVVEFFIEEQMRKNFQDHYLEYEVSPLNTLMDCYCLAPYSGILNWDSHGWRCAVKVQGTVSKDDDTDTGWTVETSIPFADLHGQVFLRPDPKQFIPKDGDEIRMNIYRIEYGIKPAQYLTWSPLLTMKSGFHNPQRFGRVIFVNKPVGSN